MASKDMAYLDLTLAMVVVGSSVVAGKLVLVEFPVFLALELRFLLAALLVLPLLYRREGGFPRLTPRAWLILGLQALCGIFCFNVCLLYGLKLTSAASAGILTSTTPAFMGLFARGFLKERSSGRTVAGIGLSMVGVLCINLAAVGDAPEAAASPFWGNLLALGAVVGESLFLLLRKAVTQPLSSLAAAAIMTALGALFFLPMAAVEARHFDFSRVGLQSWLVIAYYAGAITVLAYVLWFRGIVAVEAGAAAAFTGVMPVSALVLSRLILDEPLAPAHILACLCVAAGIYCISGLAPKRRERPARNALAASQEASEEK